MLTGLLVLLSATSPVSAAPVLFYRGVLNAASGSVQGVPGAAIARGSIFSLYGSELGPDGFTQQSSYPLTTTVSGVSIEVRQGSTRIAAIPLMVTPGQINALMPSNAPLGRVSIAVTVNGVTSNYSSATVAPSSFGIFAVNGAGSGPGSVQNVNSETDRPTNSTRNAASRGKTLIIWGTGLGPVPNDLVAPTAGTLPGQVEVFIGGKTAPVIYAGRSPCCSGIDQIVTTVPSDAPFGCFVPVQVRLGGQTTSNAVTMAISDGNTPCSDAHSPVQKLLLSGGNGGLMLATRWNVREDLISDPATDVSTDQFAALFQKYAGGEFAFDPLISLPPLGTCTTYTRSRDVDSVGLFGLLGQFPGLGSALDAGSSLRVQATTAPKSSTLLGYYAAFLGSTNSSTPPSVLNAGSAVSVVGTGGTGVGGFTANFTAPPVFDFKERASLQLISRSEPLPLSWTPASGTVLIVGINYNQPFDVSQAFVCAAAGSSGGFTVPSYVLQTLPLSLSRVGRTSGLLMVGLTVPSTFTAPALNEGHVVGLSAAVKAVLFQ
jgi:uncharacterized protein (TIGR03437 family)